MRSIQVGLLVTVFCIPFIASADVYQTDDSTIIPDGEYFLAQHLGTGLVGRPTMLIFPFQTTGSGVTTAIFRFAECTDSTYLTCSPMGTLNNNDNSTTTIRGLSKRWGYMNLATSSSYAFNPNKYYVLIFNADSSASWDFYGSTATSSASFAPLPVTETGGHCNDAGGGNLSCYNAGGSPGTVRQMAFNLIIDPTGAAGVPTINWVTPTNHGSTTAGSLVPLSFNYVIPDGYNVDTYYLKLSDLSSGIATTTYQTSGLIDDSAGNVQRLVTLTYGHLYSACVNLVSSPATGNVNYDQGCISFSAGSDFEETFSDVLGDVGGFGDYAASCPSPDNVLDVGGGIAWAFCQLFIPSVASVNRVQSLPEFISTRFPFYYVGYLNDLQTYLEAQSATSTNSASFTFPLGAQFTNPAGGSPVSSFEFFDPDDIVAAVPLLTTLRGYMIFILYALFGLFAFTRLMKVL